MIQGPSSKEQKCDRILEKDQRAGGNACCCLSESAHDSDAQQSQHDQQHAGVADSFRLLTRRGTLITVSL